MAFKSCLSILNASHYQLKKSNLEFNCMKKWNNSFPDTIAAYQKIVIPIEFGHILTWINPRARARVDYTLYGGDITQGDLVTFTILAEVVKCKPTLVIHWNSVGHVGSLCLLPYDSPNPCSPSRIVWVPGGNTVIGMFQHPEALSQRDLHLKTWTEEKWESNWMSVYRPVLSGLYLLPNKEAKSYLTLPGTHDSGTYSMQFCWTVPWTRTQNLDLYNQLMKGTRSLDFRTGFNPGQTGDRRFMLVHDVFETRVSLREALSAVKLFSCSHPMEIIVIDFHYFINLSTHAMNLSDQLIAEVAAVVKDSLDGMLIPRSSMVATLSDIWNGKERIIAAFNEATPDELVWPGVRQLWAGPSVTLIPELSEYIHYTLCHQLPLGALSSIETVLPAILPLSSEVIDRTFWVPTLTPDVSLWYYPGSKWVQKSNIIAVDFIERTNLTQLAVASSLLKGCKLVQVSRQTDG